MVQILPLTGHHERQGFDCGDEGLNHWLRNVARQHKAKGVSSTYVAVEAESSTVILGFYAINVTEIIGENLPPSWRKKLPEKIPAFRIGRLAVVKDIQGKQLGSLLLADALSRIRRVALEVGGTIVLVDAKPSAVGFYQKFGFELLADHPRNLFLPIWDE